MRHGPRFPTLMLRLTLLGVFLFTGKTILAWVPDNNQSRAARTRARLVQLMDAVDQYAVENGHPPTMPQGLQALVEPPTTLPLPRRWRPYLHGAKELPLDAWGNPYHYESPGPGRETYYIVSFGAIAACSGPCDDGDITSSQILAERHQ